MMQVDNPSTGIWGQAGLVAGNDAGTWAGFKVYGSNFAVAALAGKAGVFASENLDIISGAVDAVDQPGDIVFKAGGYEASQEKMRITSNGKVGIGTTSPSYPLEMGGGAYTDGLDWYPASSREYKEDINELTVDDAMNALKGLNPVTFNYRANKGDKHVGFIAEDVPELVATKDRKGLSPMDIVAVLTRVVKEQQKTISGLSEKVNELEREMKLKGSLALADTNFLNIESISLNTD